MMKNVILLTLILISSLCAKAQIDHEGTLFYETQDISYELHYAGHLCEYWTAGTRNYNKLEKIVFILSGKEGWDNGDKFYEIQNIKVLMYIVPPDGNRELELIVTQTVPYLRGTLYKCVSSITGKAVNLFIHKGKGFEFYFTYKPGYLEIISPIVNKKS